MENTLVQHLIQSLNISYNEISVACGRKISKSTSFRLATGRLDGAPKEFIHAFSLGLAICVKAKIEQGHSFPLHHPTIQSITEASNSAQKAG